jgi:hypothetical protein
MLAVLAMSGVASANDLSAPSAPTAPSVASSLEEVAELAPRCDPDRRYCFALQIHVAPTDQGLVVAPAWIANQLAVANQHFAQLDVGFEVAGVELATPETAHVKTRAQRSALGTGLRGGVIHVFITGQLENVDESATPVFGVAWRVNKRKIIIVSAKAWHVTLAHEIGHVFGLPHSEYPISIMNKTPRDEPPRETRTFADEEFTAMGPGIQRLLRGGVLENLVGRRR